MKRVFRSIIILFLVCLSLNVQPEGVQAFPPLPSSFYGMVKLNNANVTDGTLIEAVVNGKVIAQTYSQMYQGDSVYTLSVPGDDPSTPTSDGAKEGDVISFKIGGITAGQSGVWHSATNVELDLSADSSVTPNTPAPTPTPFPTQTAIPTQNTPAPTFTPEVYPTNTTTGYASQTPAGATATGSASTAIAPTGTSAQTAPGTATATARIQSSGTSTQTAVDEPGSKNPFPVTLVILGAGLLIGLVVAAWMFIRQMNR